MALQPLSPIEQLPDELLLDIFAYLDAASLAQAAATSSRIRDVALRDVLWTPFILHAFRLLSPPVRAAHVQPLESALPLWHPDFGLQADITHPPSWPTSDEFVRPESPISATTQEAETHQDQLDLSLFDGATSRYEVYIRFVRPSEPLLGWWASDLPFYGMVVRIILDLHFHSDGNGDTVAHGGEGLSYASATSNAVPSTNYVTRCSPSLVCQRIYPINRLQGLDSDMERWSDVTSFPMPSNPFVVSQGTSLRRSLAPIRNDLCEPGLRTENLWHLSWDDIQRGGVMPPDPTSASRSSSSANNVACASDGFHAHISSQSWLHSLKPHDDADRSSSSTIGGGHFNDDDADREEFFENEAEEIDQVLGAEDDPRNVNVRSLMVGPHRHTARSLEHRIDPLSSAVTMRANDDRDNGIVQVSMTPWQPYVHANERNAAFRQPPSFVVPLPPTLFPPPALLPAIRSPPWSRLNRVQIGISNIWETMSAQSRWLIQGEGTLIDSLAMTPAPPYRPWPIQAHTLEAEPRFFPIFNPQRASLMEKPKIKLRALEQEAATPASLASFGPEIRRNTSVSTSPAPIMFEHVKPPPQHDPAHVEFDWDAVEGLYSMTYGPHGIELLYIRARKLTSLDFEPDDRLPAWPAEPLLSSDDMYGHRGINRRSAARIGARVLEAVKVLGDPNIPRGQITWRAFIDDPGRSAVPWRPPPDGFRKHTPWPLRPALGNSSQEERSPGLILPAHGRVAGEGFVGPGWATALACVSSIDEIQVWWLPMFKISIAKKLIGV